METQPQKQRRGACRTLCLLVLIGVWFIPLFMLGAQEKGEDLTRVESHDLTADSVPANLFERYVITCLQDVRQVRATLPPSDPPFPVATPLDLCQPPWLRPAYDQCVLDHDAYRALHTKETRSSGQISKDMFLTECFYGRVLRAQIVQPAVVQKRTDIQPRSI